MRKRNRLILLVIVSCIVVILSMKTDLFVFMQKTTKQHFAVVIPLVWLILYLLGEIIGRFIREQTHSGGIEPGHGRYDPIHPLVRDYIKKDEN